MILKSFVPKKKKCAATPLKECIFVDKANMTSIELLQR